MNGTCPVQAMDRAEQIAVIIVFGLLLTAILTVLDTNKRLYDEQNNIIVIGEAPDQTYEQLPLQEARGPRSGYSITNETLEVTVAHGGGCPDREPRLEIYWDGTAVSQNGGHAVSLDMVHTNYDRCEAIVTSKHRIPLEPFRSELDLTENMSIEIREAQISIQEGSGPF